MLEREIAIIIIIIIIIIIVIVIIVCKVLGIQENRLMINYHGHLFVIYKVCRIKKNKNKQIGSFY